MTRMVSKAGLALVGALIGVSFMTGAASAQGTSRQREACTPDVFRLCSSDIPNVQRIVACLNRQKSSLSRECRAVMNGDDGGERTARR
jgi:hypothetical protein